MQQHFGYYLPVGDEVGQCDESHAQQPFHDIVRQARTVGAVNGNLRHSCQSCFERGGAGCDKRGAAVDKYVDGRLFA